MKIGLRTPSLKKTIRARTTGRVKRAVKSGINPIYGKNGIGFIKSPKRSIMNRVYKRTTFDIFKKFR